MATFCKQAITAVGVLVLMLMVSNTDSFRPGSSPHSFRRWIRDKHHENRRHVVETLETLQQQLLDYHHNPFSSYRVNPMSESDPSAVNGASSLKRSTNNHQQTSKEPAIFAVSASQVEKDLQTEERTTVRVVREAGPSVAFVTSVWPTGNTTQKRQGRRRRNGIRDENNNNNQNSQLPSGVPLGSGSAFVVDPDGYLVTNFHVIERVYQMRQMEQQLRNVWQHIWGNLTGGVDVNDAMPLLNWIVPTSMQQALQRPLPAVYIRLPDASQTKYTPCRIVHVQPDLDLAVLQIEWDGDQVNEKLPSMFFGTSSDLLVGQGLIAIGNPFGLDNSVTTGVVSALNRELQTGTNFPTVAAQPQPIRNCIQTDCAINPGNSGGPLLNLQGQVVGVNTAIVSTTGSFAGIGFAVPSDAVQPVVERAIRNDKVSHPRGGRPSQTPWMGVQIVQAMDSSSSTNVPTSRLVVAREDDNTPRNWVWKVAQDSPAEKAGIRGMTVEPSSAMVVFGDAIVAVGGNAVKNFKQLQAEMDQRNVGEQVAVTIEDGVTGERRVVYLCLAAKPRNAVEEGKEDTGQ